MLLIIVVVILMIVGGGGEGDIGFGTVDDDNVHNNSNE
jgi:hypothetical protein